MRRKILSASYGDITLHKFILVPMDKISGEDEDNYDVRLGGYFYLWDYTYNKKTRETDDRNVTHSDMIDAMPAEIRKHCRDICVWGRTDFYRDDVRFISVNDEYITSDQLDLIKRYCGMSGE